MTSTPPVALSIAGSDSGGGAGVQADLRMFGALGVHGCSAISALTAQNTSEVREVFDTPATVLRAQIEAVVDDFDVAATKTGMLGTVENIRVVAEVADAGRLPRLVVDPVLVSSSGHRLLEAGAEHAYLDELLPHAQFVTPNMREAACLLGRPVTTRDDQIAAAEEIGERSGVEWVVVKGGDAPELDRQALAVDIARSPSQVIELAAPRVDTPNIHGTGCSFAAAIAALSARGEQPPDLLHHAKAIVNQAIERSSRWRLGAGHGPTDPLDLTARRTATALRPTPTEPGEHHDDDRT